MGDGAHLHLQHEASSSSSRRTRAAAARGRRDGRRELLEDEAQVFKLIGPVLVKQELVEVKNNVTKRVEFIKNDISRLGDNIAAKEKQQDEVRKAKAVVASMAHVLGKMLGVLEGAVNAGEGCPSPRRRRARTARRRWPSRSSS